MAERYPIESTVWARSHAAAIDYSEDYGPRREASIEAGHAASYTHGGPVSGRPIASPDHQGQTQAFGRTLTPRHQYADGEVVPEQPPNTPERSMEPQGAQAYYGQPKARRRAQGMDSFE